MRILSLLILVLTAQLAFAQSDKAGLKSTLDKYFTYVKAGENDKVLDYMPPEMFEIAPRAMLLETLNSLNSDPTMKIGFDDYSFDGSTEAVTHEGVKYALADYSFDLVMQFIEEEGQETDPTTWGLMLGVFESQYGADNVKFDPTTNTFTIRNQTQMLAVKKESYNGWKFIENNAEAKLYLGELFPTEALEKLGI